MPEYDFQCQDCQHEFTLSETYDEHNRHREKCPKCGSKHVEQLITSIHVQTSKKT